jgi:pyridoxamine 5'-phosphate oxidase
MTVATTTPDGRPSARIVLLKEVDERGFVFFTNYGSRKGQELDANPRAALVFHWNLLQRQVRVEGRIERTSKEESEAYFHSRPRGSQIGAWASRQSQSLASRAELVEQVATMEARFPDGEVPLPEFWGGYRVIPEAIEFWQGRLYRLHDRVRFESAGNGWKSGLLFP